MIIMNTNSFIIGKLYKTTERCCYFAVVQKRNGKWVDGRRRGGDIEIEVEPGTVLMVLDNPDDRLCSVVLMNEQTVWAYDVDVEELRFFYEDQLVAL